MVEYAVILSLAVMVGIGVVQRLGSQVACAYTQTSNALALTDGGCSISTWGFAWDGQLGNGSGNGTASTATPGQIPNETSIQSAAGGDLNGYLVTPEGEIYGWGQGWAGQLGDGQWNKQVSPTQQTYSDGTPMTGFTQVATDGDHVIALRNDGTVWAWGRNDTGGLGDATTAGRDWPEQVCSVNFDYAADEDGSGYVPTSLLWDNNPPASPCAATSSYLTGVTQIAVASGSNFALLKDGSVVAWGAAWDNTLGIGYASAPSPCGPNWTAGPFQCSPVPTPVCGGTAGYMTAPCSSYMTGVSKIYAAGNTTFAQMQDGSVVAWGDDSYGQLGNGTECHGDPANVGNTECPGPVAGGDYTSPVAVPALNGVTQIAGGSWHALALKADGTVMGWGYNGSGQIGNGSHCVVGWLPSCYANTTPAAIPGLSEVTDIAGGGDTSAAVDSNGALWMWGDNSEGQLGRLTCPIVGGDVGYDPQPCWAAGDGTPTQVAGVSGITAVYLEAVTTIAVSKDVTQTAS